MVFLPGNAANPGGRSKSKPTADALRHIAAQPAKIDGFGRPVVVLPPKPRNIDIIAARLVEKCFKGDIPAIREFMDRTEGTVDRSIKGSDDPDANPIQVEDITMKEAARRLAYILTQGAEEPEKGEE